MLNEQEVFDRLAQIACPTCLQSDHEWHFRCDFGSAQCLYEGVCRHCGQRFDVENTAPMSQHIARIWTQLRHVSGPVCGAADLVGQFVCDLAARECYLRVYCRFGDFERRADGLAAASRPW